MFAWITVGGFTSTGLNFFVIAAALGLILLSWSMGKTYFQTVLERLDRGKSTLDEELVQTQFVGGELTMTITQFDMTMLTGSAGQVPTPKWPGKGRSRDRAGFPHRPARLRR